uniref:Uncharacterized protein n=1 Tax=mine drainage metagenome TaxID=410659 RepID=E6PWU1_9ZZZZ
MRKWMEEAARQPTLARLYESAVLRRFTCVDPGRAVAPETQHKLAQAACVAQIPAP